TGTSTTGETGSLLSTHSSASYSPGANPEASKVTVTSLLAPGAVTPALGETDSQSGRAHPCRSCPVTAITRCTCGKPSAARSTGSRWPQALEAKYDGAVWPWWL